MTCMYCLQDVEEYGPLGYCERCRVWYRKEGEEIQAVYRNCITAKSAPERCNEFVQSLLMRGEELPDSGEIPLPNITLNNIHRADMICAACENKNFVLE